MDADKPADRSRSTVGAAYSALIGWSATRTVPTALRPLAYRAFARAVGANLEEAELALDEYPSFGDFFARRLRTGARSIDPDRRVIISPSDGVAAAVGTVEHGTLVQAKGRNYTLAELLASEDFASKFEGGEYGTIYLSPRDYHRVHTPITGRIRGFTYVPGALWPVNPKVVARRDGVFSRNERVVIELNCPELGDVALVMVGAAGVGNIVLRAGGEELSSAALRRDGQLHRVELDVAVERGDELGAFRLGSTVILVFGRGRARLGLSEGHAVSFGEAIGQMQGIGGVA